MTHYLQLVPFPPSNYNIFTLSVSLSPEFAMLDKIYLGPPTLKKHPKYVGVVLCNLYIYTIENVLIYTSLNMYQKKLFFLLLCVWFPPSCQRSKIWEFFCSAIFAWLTFTNFFLFWLAKSFYRRLKIHKKR